MSQAQTRTVRKKAVSLSLSAKFFTLALHVRLRAQHPPTADKRFLRSSSRCKVNKRRASNRVRCRIQALGDFPVSAKTASTRTRALTDRKFQGFQDRPTRRCSAETNA